MKMTSEEAKRVLIKFVEEKTTMPSEFLKYILDVDFVRHGRWIWSEDAPLKDGQTEYDREAWYQCSKCDAYDLRLKNSHSNYCWSCGAKMDEVNND